MDCSSPSKPELVIIQQPRTHPPTSKKRRMVQKTVITVKIEANGGLQRGNGPPSDSWSWRKYGQKPIKGSPYPRGYYKCSTSKGCSAKKQVERCRTDSSVLIITYTSDHNHPGPDVLNNTTTTSTTANNNNSNNNEQSLSPQPASEEHPPVPNSTLTASSTITCQKEHNNENESNHQSPLGQQTEEEKTHDEEFMALSPISTNQPPVENDFFDELEDLVPISGSSSSLFTSLVRNSFFDERSLLLLS